MNPTAKLTRDWHKFRGTVTVGNRKSVTVSNVLKEAAPQTWSTRDERRRQLLDAADTVVRRMGAAASMDDIADEAGITKPILYRHFGDKGGLSRALAERYVDQLMRELDKAFARSSSPASGLASAIDTYVRFVERNAPAYRFLMNGATAERSEAQAEIRQFIHRIASELSTGMSQQLERAGLEASGSDAWAYATVGSVQLATDWWLEERPYSRSKLVDYLVQMLWGGLAGLGRPSSKSPVSKERRTK